MLLAVRLGLRPARRCGSRHRLLHPPKPSISHVLLRHQHKKAAPNVPVPSPEEQNSLSGMLLRFIRKETQFLSDSMKIDESVDPEPQTASNKIDPALLAQLSTEPDSYHQYVMLLRLPKFAVHPDVLLLYHLLLPQVEETEKQLLLRRLVFYGQWHLFWQLCITDATSLSDIEDIVDLLHSELHICHNTYLGVWQALRAASHETSTSGLLTSIVETVQYKFELSKAQVSVVMGFLNELDNVENKEELELFEESHQKTISEDAICKAFYLQAQVSLLDQKTFMGIIREEPRILQTPGWFSFLTSSMADTIPYLASGQDHTPKVIERSLRLILMTHFLHLRLAHINESDFFSLLQTATAKDAHRIFLIAYKNSQRGYLQSQRLLDYVVQMALLSPKEDVKLEAVKKFYKHMSPDSLKSAFPFILSKCPKILESIEGKRPDLFQRVCLECMDDMTSPRDIAILIGHCNNNRLIIRRALKVPKKEDSDVLLRDLERTKFTAYNLIELLRFAFRHKITDDRACAIFDRILKKTWNTTALEKRGQAINYQFEDDFRFYYAMASKDERSKLSQTLQTLGQAISTLETPLMADFINNLYDYLFASKNFTFIQSTTGKTYILDRLLKKTMPFVYKNYTTEHLKDGVKQIRNILKLLKFDSPTGQASVFEFIVHDEPSMAFEILKNYKSRKSALTNPIMEGMARGLLRSKRLTPSQRVVAFEKFRRSAKDMGYKHELSARLVVLFGNLILKLDNQQRREYSDLLQNAIELAFSKEVPLAVIKNWSKAKI